MRPEELYVVIDSLSQDINPEGIHLELKRKWGDFSNNRFKENFIKSLTALVNARGDSNRHLIFGLSKSGVFDAPLPTDESNIQQLVGSNVDPPFSFEVKKHEVEGKIVTVLKILKSIKRPHVVKEHNKRENCIFVRRGSTIAFANRNELDEMYSERYEEGKPDLYCDIISEKTSYAQHGYKGYTITGIALDADIFNKGSQRTSIRSISVIIDDEMQVSNFIIINQSGEELKLPITIDGGECQRLILYLSLKEMMDKTRAQGNRKIAILLKDLYGNEASDEKTIEIS